jgi:hypothetical protein
MEPNRFRIATIDGSRDCSAILTHVHPPPSLMSWTFKLAIRKLRPQHLTSGQVTHLAIRAAFLSPNYWTINRLLVDMADDTSTSRNSRVVANPDRTAFFGVYFRVGGDRDGTPEFAFQALDSRLGDLA